MHRPSIRSLLRQPKPLVSPVAHDALSARMIERAGFEATGVAGSAMLAAQHALPDIGLASLAEMLEGVRVMLRGTRLPWGADADDGFGDVKNVVHTVRCFEQAGASQLVIEDQHRATKRPGDGGSQTLVTPDQMISKLRAALESRDDPEYLMIVARTDAAGTEGVDAALSRADRYLSAGADAIFIAGLQSPEQLRRAGEALRGAVQITAIGERRIRIWPAPAELYAMGYNMISYPGLLINRVHAAIEEGLDSLGYLASGAVRPCDLKDHVQALDAMATTLDLVGWERVDARFGAA